MNPIVVPPKDRDLAIQRVAKFLSHCLPGRPLRVLVEENKPERSDLQNRALWGVAYKELREQTGNDMEDLHAYFCGEFFGWSEYEVLGTLKKRPRRTTTRDENGKRDVIPTTEMTQFYDFLQRRSAENGYHVSDPDALWFMRQQESQEVRV